MPPPDPELNKRSASASAPEHDQTAGPYGTVRATTGKGEEKETLTLNLKEEGRGDKGSVLTGEKVAAGGESRAIAVASGSRHAPPPPSRPCLRCAAARNFSAPLE
uniref:Uncharacterized protein n=1 Tax=Oryza barthii TaxID=65489 RepID=A0A0D3HV79_9ORYZ